MKNTTSVEKKGNPKDDRFGKNKIQGNVKKKAANINKIPKIK